MDEVLAESIQRARELFATVRHAAMATVNEDGSPHNTPFHYIIDPSLEYLYWASSPASVHQRNLARTGRAFIVMYEPGQGGGLYMQAENAHELSGAEYDEGLKVWNTKRAEEGREPLGPDFFADDAPQRMYRADLTRFWVNHSEKDAAGNVLRDIRSEINRKDLQN